jgi:hypothetical protein
MSELAKKNQKQIEKMLSDSEEWANTDFDKKNETT